MWGLAPGHPTNIQRLPMGGGHSNPMALSPQRSHATLLRSTCTLYHKHEQLLKSMAICANCWIRQLCMVKVALHTGAGPVHVNMPINISVTITVP